ncbi:MAG: hypothetical protein NTX25_01430 [Proteobacteria bacterium]|nr:hypothetical protein [Pseudomonadota bacterium]
MKISKALLEKAANEPVLSDIELMDQKTEEEKLLASLMSRRSNLVVT